MRVILSILALLLAPASFAQALNSADQAGTLCRDAVARIAEGNAAQGYDLLKPHWFMPENELANLATRTQSQMKLAVEQFGPVMGVEAIDRKEVGNSLLGYRYLLKMEKHAFRFACVFYKPQSTWRIDSFWWDDKLADMF